MSDWEQRYQQGDTGWDRGHSSPALHRWLDSGLLTPCRILIPGCGRGHEVVTLARLGFDVTAIDIAPSAIAHLQQQLDDAKLAATLFCNDLFAYTTAAPFDAIYEQTCLCAMPPNQRTAYEQAMRRWLRPEGTLFALFMQTMTDGGPPFHCDIEEMPQLFPDKQWRWHEDHTLRVDRDSGKFELGRVLTRRGKEIQ